MLIQTLARKLLPLPVRMWLRKQPFIQVVLRRLFGGVRSVPYPGTPYTIFFDGYLNISFAATGADQFEHEMKTLVTAILPVLQPKVLWDVGANIGSWGLFFAASSREFDTIYLYEPDPINIKYLELNGQANQIAGWVARNVAVSDRTGKREFQQDNLTGATGSLEAGPTFVERYFKIRSSKLSVDTVSLDDEIASGYPAPSLLKVDVEGHEAAVLRGASQLLSRYRPTIVLECTEACAEIRDIFQAHDYRMFSALGAPILMPEYMTLAIPGERNDIMTCLSEFVAGRTSEST